ncbi:ABC transporter substrate-binding protein [Devriesea agamarum]|uniref:ABC transporter substrate-binding protein n=1 Tax=Devriesea agamarum TaxID=472569 RepID=UPI000A01FFA1|nr:sugar ABC transporter substrate-binding protein [Devriesea agamarum]
MSAQHPSSQDHPASPEPHSSHNAFHSGPHRGHGNRSSRRSFLTATVATSVAALAGAGLAGCSTGSTGGRIELDYWLWDANQLPAYEKAIKKFEEKYPNISVRITQLGWNDYWTKLTASFVAGASPDVFANHLAKYPQMMSLGVIAKLDQLGATKGLRNSDFKPGLADLWVGTDGHRYGVPKDYDTMALLFDRKTVEASDLTSKDLQNLTWNPDNGGTFEQVLAHLSVDKSGRRGDQRGFDKNNVATYGLAVKDKTDYIGQAEWSSFALATGWYYMNKKTWGTRFQFDDERFQSSLNWWVGLSRKGFMPKFGEVGPSITGSQQLASHRAALAVDGSWMIGTYAKTEGIELGMASIPSGPIGHPVSLYNGLGDSVSAHSRHPEEASRLAAFLGSPESQRIVGDQAIVFPATEAGTEAAISAYRQRGIDVTAFTDRVKLNQTALYPLADHAAQIQAIMQPAMDAVWIGSMPIKELTSYNDKVNALFT